MSDETTQENTAPTVDVDAAIAEATSGLSAKNKELLSQIKSLKSNQLPDGVSMDDIKALNEYREKMKADEEALLKEKGEFDTIKQNIHNEWQQKYDEKDSEYNAVRRDLDTFMARDAIMKALGEAKALDAAELLMPHILPHVKNVRTDGGYEVQVFNNDQRAMTDTGEYKSLKHVINEMKTNPLFSVAFAQNNQGGGARGSNSGFNGAENPFKTGNMTEQVRLLNDNPSLAREMAKSAGKSIP